jgi:hypothetical protein
VKGFPTTLSYPFGGGGEGGISHKIPFFNLLFSTIVVTRAAHAATIPVRRSKVALAIELKKIVCSAGELLHIHDARSGG